MVDLNGGLEVSHTLVEMRRQIELLQERVSALEAVKPPESDKADLADLRSKVEKMLGTAPSGPAANPQIANLDQGYQQSVQQYAGQQAISNPRLPQWAQSAVGPNLDYEPALFDIDPKAEEAHSKSPFSKPGNDNV